MDGGGAGFARAANLGRSTSPYEVVIFVNPDSRPTIEDYREMVRTVVADVSCASASATMVSADGLVELGTAGWEPTLRRALVHAAGMHKVLPAGRAVRPTRGRTS